MIDKKTEVLHRRRLSRWPARREMGVRINTVMQTCFFKLAEACCLRTKRSRTSRKRSRRPTASGARSRACSATTRRSTVRVGALKSRSPVPAQGRRRRRSRICRPCPTDAPEFVKNVLGEIIANRGDQIPVSAMPCRRHVPRRHDEVREAQRSRWTFPFGTQQRVHPVRPVLAGLPARRRSA